MKIEYPKYIFHKSEPAKIVHSKEEHDEHEGWAEEPFESKEAVAPSEGLNPHEEHKRAVEAMKLPEKAPKEPKAPKEAKVPKAKKEKAPKE